MRADAWTLRRYFNEDRIDERTGPNGDISIRVLRSTVCRNHEIHDWVEGTLSQHIGYYNSDGNLIAKAHRYLRPDGMLAGSGLPDPKRLIHQAVMYIVELPAEAEV